MGRPSRVAAIALALAVAFPVAAERLAPLPYVVRAGDTLIGLGRTLLADPGRWREVARFNKLRDPDHLPVGSVLLIAPQLLRREFVEASVVQLVGDVRGPGGKPVKAGDKLPEGSSIETGEDGYVTLRLVDGTLLRVQAASRAQIEASRRYPALDAVDSAVRLQRGRLEVQVPPVQGGKPGFEVRTPQGVLAVRGTEYRVAAESERVQTRGEVLDGVVSVGSERQQRSVPAGFGTVVDSAGRVAEPVALLPPPDLGGLPALQERALLRFAVPAQPLAAGYRALVARDRGFQEVVGEVVATAPELRFAGLPDGAYFLRVRAVDSRGLEGRSAEHAFRLKARPEPPLPSRPAPRTTLSGSGAEFAWSANPQAASYRFQLASDPAFRTLVRERDGLTETELALDGLPPGRYHWRVASVRAGDDRGPWGDALTLELRAPPRDPQPPAVGDNTVELAWSGDPGQVFDLQVARDRGFADLLVDRRLAEPAIALARPAPGTYFVRFRAIDPDGFVGPFSGVQSFAIVNCVVDASRSCVRTTDGPLRSP